MGMKNKSRGDKKKKKILKMGVEKNEN